MKKSAPPNDFIASSRPIGRLLIPTDFSPGSYHAIERAVLIASHGKCRIELLHVMTPRLQPVERQKVRRRLESATRFARDLGRAVGIPSGRFSAALRTGEPHVQIICRARENNVDIVVMGRSRPVRGVRRLIGTTSARVARMNDSATLIVARRARVPYRRPLIAIEIDPSARNIIELTQCVAPSAELPLRLVHAFAMPFADHYLATDYASSRWYRRQSRKSTAESISKLLASIGFTPTTVKVALLHGDPREVILADAARFHADLVSLGTHGRGGVAHALLGSVAEWVVAHTARDVLVARPVRFTFVPP
jgi:nucleotide-binding universal stress UspA family protein